MANPKRIYWDGCPKCVYIVELERTQIQEEFFVNLKLFMEINIIIQV